MVEHFKKNPYTKAISELYSTWTTNKSKKPTTARTISWPNIFDCTYTFGSRIFKLRNLHPTLARIKFVRRQLE